MKKYDIPLEYFQSRLVYDGNTGRLMWKDGQRGGYDVGCVTRNAAGNEYRYMSIGYKGKCYNFMVHQVIWFMCEGVWAKEIDHENGNGLDNRKQNLRSVCRPINSMNHKRQRNNSSGLPGVSFVATKCQWRAYGTENNVQVHLAYTPDFFEAICARKSWENLKPFTERHGK